MNTQDLTKDAKGEIVIYQSEEGRVSVDVLFQDETVWLPIEQMSILFGKSRSTINEHILNIYKEGELSEADTVRKIGISDFSTKPTNFYNLDVVIPVGYRVHSVQGTRFRQWAIQRIHEYIIKGYTLDDERLKGNGGRYFRKQAFRARNNKAISLFYREYRESFMAFLDNKFHSLNRQLLAEVFQESVSRVWENIERGKLSLLLGRIYHVGLSDFT